MHVPGLNHQSSDCQSVRRILTRVGDKWSILLVMILAQGPQRFNFLLRGIEGISQRMLTLTLRELERDGLVSRRVEPTVPPSVYYDLTKLGRTLLEPVMNLGNWAKTHQAGIAKAQQEFDKKLQPKRSQNSEPIKSATSNSRN